jgi:hypothetical protein
MHRDVKIGAAVGIVLAGAIIVYFVMTGGAAKPKGPGQGEMPSTPRENTVVQVLPEKKPPLTSQPADSGILVPGYAERSPAAEPTTKPAQTDSFNPGAIEVIKTAPAPAIAPGGEPEKPVVVPFASPAAANKPAPVAAASVATFYTVTASDTGGFYDIAKKHYGSTRYVYLVQQANPGVDPAHLRVGQRLTMPPVPSGEATAPGPAAVGEIYIVQKDDRLWDIAKAKYGRGEDWALIRRANPGIDPDHLSAGQRLIIPPKSASTAAAPTTRPSATTKPATRTAPPASDARPYFD